MFIGRYSSAFAAPHPQFIHPLWCTWAPAFHNFPANSINSTHRRKRLIGDSFLPRFGHYNPPVPSLHSRSQYEALQPKLSLDRLSIQVAEASPKAKRFINAVCTPRLPLPPSSSYPWKSCILSFKLWHLVKQFVKRATQSGRQADWERLNWSALINRQVSVI